MRDVAWGVPQALPTPPRGDRRYCGRSPGGSVDDRYKRFLMPQIRVRTCKSPDVSRGHDA